MDADAQAGKVAESAAQGFGQMGEGGRRIEVEGCGGRRALGAARSGVGQASEVKTGEVGSAGHFLLRGAECVEHGAPEARAAGCADGVEWAVGVAGGVVAGPGGEAVVARMERESVGDGDDAPAGALGHADEPLDVVTIDEGVGEESGGASGGSADEGAAGGQVVDVRCKM